MSAVARKSFFQPHWLAIVLVLAIAWLVYRPFQPVSVRAVEPTEQVSETEPDCGGQCSSECQEGNCDATKVIAASDLHLEPIQHTTSESDEVSIYGDVAVAADPFLVAETVPAATDVVPVQYVEPVEVTENPLPPPCPEAETVALACPSRLPPTVKRMADAPCPSNPCATARSGIPRTCSLTDLRSGTTVATLTIASEIRSEALDLATYQHIPSQCHDFAEDEHPAPETQCKNEVVRLCPVGSETETVAYDAPAAHADSAATTVTAPRSAIHQTIEQSQHWIQSGHIDEAVDLLTNALFEHPLDVQLLQHTAVAYLAKRDTESALAAMEQCLAIDRENADSNEVMSLVLKALGQENRARHYADHAVFLRRTADANGQRQQ